MYFDPRRSASRAAIIRWGRCPTGDEMQGMQVVPGPKVGRRKRSHEIVDLLEKAINSGEFEIGSQLPSEKVLAERFGVGRPSVREALFLLQQQGFVDVTSGTRARVTTPTNNILIGQLVGFIKRVSATPQGQTHMEQVRLLFEPGVAWQAAQVATDEDVARLKRTLDANVAAFGNIAEFIRTDVAFHYELNAITKNPIFAAVHEVLVEWLIDQRTTTIHMPDADRFSVRDHTAIYDAVAARDPMRAFHEMGSHLRLISQLYHESKRLSQEILRDITRDVAERMDREKQSIWSGSLAREADGARAKRVRSAKVGKA
jgi:GntR family transcriptional regulator, sialic acid-inducible nan operon repressor